MLSGDNLTKARTDPLAAARARERYVAARALAVTAGRDDLVAIIDLRLTDAAQPDATA